MTPTQRILDQIQQAQKLSEGATPLSMVDAGSGPGCAPAVLRGDHVRVVVDHREDFGEPLPLAEFISASVVLVPRLARQLEEAIKALEQASDIVHGEFCGRSGHHDCCEDVNAALSRIEQLGEEGK